MENILSKALSEVLTVRYSDELRDAFDTGYTASDEFEARMRELIRKTDRPPIYRYTKVIASLAAVAVIAVGAAFIVPALTRNTVTVSPPETTTASTPSATISGTVQITTETAPGTTTDTSETAVGTSVPDVSAEESDTQDTSADSVVVVDDTTTTTTTQTTTTTAATSSETTDGNEELTVGPADDSDEVVVDEETDSDDDTDEDYYDDDDDDDDLVDDVDGDDTVIIGDDDDDDAAYDGPSPHTETAKKVTVNSGDTLDSVFSENFGGTTFAVLYANSGIYSSGGKNASLNFYWNDYGFVQDFLHKLGSAKADTSGASVQDQGKPTLSLHLTNAPYSVHRYTDLYANNSYWLHYKDYFAVPLNEEDDGGDTVIDDDEDDPDSNISFQIKIYSGTGAVEFTQRLWYADREANTSSMYDISTVFYMDMSEVNKLFERCEKMFMPANAKTVGDIIDGLGLNADNITQASASVYDIYDTSIGRAKIGYSFIAEIFEKYRTSKVTAKKEVTGNGAVHLFIVTKTNAQLTVKFNHDRTIYITDGYYSYSFKATFDDIVGALHAIEAANGIKIPMYSTLSDYLKGKGFDKLTKIQFAISDSSQGKTSIYTLTDEASLEKLRKLIVSEAKTAEYITEVSPYTNTFASGIYVNVNGWRWAVRIDGDELLIQSGTRNVFRLSAGFTEKLRKLVMEDENVMVETSDDVNDDTDDVEPDDDDANPVTD